MTTFRGKNITLKGEALQVGDHMPKFRVIDKDMQEVNSTQLHGIRVFLSVPSLDTGVCSSEIAKFNAYMCDQSDVTCMSVSMDLPFALARWCQANASDNIKTAADYHLRSFADATSTYINELGLLTRACFVVDEENIVRHVEYVNEISQEPNYEAVLTTVRNLKQMIK